MRAFLRRPGGYVTLVLVATAAGFTLRSVLPPFVLDDPFWRAFLSGPPAAGIFALLGAVVAFGAAAIAARTARENARRQEWWHRAEWALAQVMSEDPDARTVGLESAVLLVNEATAAEAAMIDAVTGRFLPTAPRSDSDAKTDGQ